MTKKLSLFTEFNAQKFLAEKQLMALNQDVLFDEHDKHIGSIITVVVFDDKTDYGDESITNAGDSYKVKVENKDLPRLELPAFVELVAPKGKVWGEYRNNLSLSAKNVKVIGEINGTQSN